MDIVGTRGFKGKKTRNSNTMFNTLFETVDDEDDNEMSEDDAVNIMQNHLEE
jgi:hypothetical protein